jgi:surface carbohydrate biosynthesis protein (TIGR04326 family)
MNILYAVSRKHRLPLLEKRLRGNTVSRIRVCPLDYGLDGPLEEMRKAAACRGVEFHVVDFLTEFNEKAFSIKDPYLSFIRGLGERPLGSARTLEEHFKLFGRPLSVWWLSLIAEKNPYKSSAYTLLAKALTLIDLAKGSGSDEIWLDEGLEEIGAVLEGAFPPGKVRPLRRKGLGIFWNSGGFLFVKEQLRMARFLAGFLFKVAALKVSRGFLRERLRRLRESAYLLVTMFPLLDGEALSRGKFVNRAYGSLQRAVQEGVGEPIAWFGMYTRIEGVKWKDAVHLAKKVHAAGETFFLHEEFIGFKECLALIFSYGLCVLRTLFSYAHYPRLFRYTRDSSDGIDVWPLFKKDFLASFAGKELMVQLSYYHAFSGALSRFRRDGVVLHFAEMHGWERALNAGVDEYASMRSVGLQHTIVPLLLLNYFQGGLDRGPRPDFLACAGKIPYQLFLKDGWPPEKVFVLGAFRFQGLGEILQARGQREPAKKEQIVVAFSIDESENEEILRLLHDAFSAGGEDVRVLLKDHPHTPVRETLRKMKLRLDPQIFSITADPLPKLMLESRAMIVKESSSVLYALAAGIPVIVPMLYGMVDLCPLSGLSDIAWYVRDADELSKTVIRAMEKGGVAKSDESLRVLREYLEIFETEECYYRRLEQILLRGGTVSIPSMEYAARAASE